MAEKEPQQLQQGLSEETIKEIAKNQQETENTYYALLAKAEEEHIAFEELDAVLFGPHCNSYNRFSAFCEFMYVLQDDVYWKALGSVYVSSDNLYRYRHSVKAAFAMPWPNRHLLMSKEEQEALQKLPQTLTIYRCMSEEEARLEEYGVSWTLSKEVAGFFLNEYWRNHDTAHLRKTIVEIQVPKAKIVALFNSREEQEVIHLG